MGRTRVARLIGVGHVPPDAGWRMASHRHRFHEMIVLFRGRMALRVADQDMVAGAGDVLFYRSGVTHAERSAPDDPFESFFLSMEWEPGVDPVPVRVLDAAGRIRSMIRWLHEEWPVHATTGGGVCGAFFRGILDEWLRLVRNPEHGLVASVREHIRRRIDAPLDLEELAGVAGMSKFHFVRVYKALADRTPMADVRAERLRHAQHLVATTYLPLKDIAPRCGLGDEYRLCRLFRQHLGVTPGEVRMGLGRIRHS